MSNNIRICSFQKTSTTCLCLRECVSICVCEREKKREREIERRKTERGRKKEREHKERERKKENKRERLQREFLCLSLCKYLFLFFQYNNDRTQSNTWLWDESNEWLHKIAKRMDHVTQLKIANPYNTFDDSLKTLSFEIETSEAWQVEWLAKQYFRHLIQVEATCCNYC